MKEHKKVRELRHDTSITEMVETAAQNTYTESLPEKEQEEVQMTMSKIGVKFGLGLQETESARSDTWKKIVWKISVHSNTRKLSHRMVRAAAAVVILLGVGFGVLSVFKNSSAMVAVANENSDAMEIILEDSTRVWLHSGAEISFPKKFPKKHRPVSLTGEAFFAVISDPERPFIVRTEIIDVEVLGTKFNVRAEKNDSITEVVLESGSIALRQAGVQQMTIVKPGELAVVDHSTSSIDISRSDPYLHSVWKEKEFVFRSEPLGRIMLVLEKAYEKEIVLVNATIANTLYSGRFKKSAGLEDALSVIQMNYNITYYYDEEGRIIIK